MVGIADMPVLPGGGWLGHMGGMQKRPLSLLTMGAGLGEDIVRLRLGPIKAYVVYGPELVHQVLVENPDRFGRNTRGSILLRKTLGLSTLTAEGDEWRWRRRLAQPSFKRSALAALDRPIVAGAERVADEMIVHRGPTNVSAAMGDLALQIACAALFGEDLGEDAPIVHRALTEVLEGFIPIATSVLPGLERLPIPSTRRYWGARQDLTGVVERIVARRRASGNHGSDLLGTWLDGSRPGGGALTAEDLDAEGVTMLLAAHETTANAMSFTLGLLARHPSVARKLVAELVRVLGDRPATAADLERLPYLDAVVREGLRLYPPAWIVSRSTNEPVTIGGHPIPAGAFLYVPIYAIHRLPAFWDDPEGFDPDRWVDGRAEVAKKAGAYLPFGMGQRRCVGEPLGMLEARLVLATLLRKVRLQLMPGQSLEHEVSVTLRPRGGLWMTASPFVASECPVHRAAEPVLTAPAEGCPVAHG